MAVHSNKSFIGQAVHTTTLRLCQAIRDDQLLACRLLRIIYLIRKASSYVYYDLRLECGLGNLSCLEYAHLTLTH